MQALMPPGRARILSELLLRPERELYLRELAGRARVSLSTAQSELRRLTAAGILRRTQRGRQTFYRADTSSPIYPDLRALLTKTVGLGDALREALAGVKGVRLAFVYGSVARGEDRPGSDIDVLVVGSAKPRALSDALAAAEREIGREVNIVALTPGEFAERVRRKNRFLSEALAEPKIPLVGGEDEAARLAGQRRPAAAAADAG